MSRNLVSALQTAFTSARLAPVLFVEVQFVSGWVRVWSGVGSVVWGGNTWVGIQLPNGEVLGAISKLSERSDMQSMSAAFSLSGIPTTSVQQVLAECRQGFPANIYLGAANIDTGALLADPYRSWGGNTDVTTIADTGDTCTVTISVESRLIDLQRSPDWTYTDQDQQLFSPGDSGFKFVSGLQNKTVYWGKQGPVIPGSNVGGLAGIGRGGIGIGRPKVGL